MLDDKYHEHLITQHVSHCLDVNLVLSSFPKVASDGSSVWIYLFSHPFILSYTIILKVDLGDLVLILFEDSVLEASLVIEVQSDLQKAKDLDVAANSSESSDHCLIGYRCNRKRIVVIVILEEDLHCSLPKVCIDVSVVRSSAFEVKGSLNCIFCSREPQLPHVFNRFYQNGCYLSLVICSKSKHWGLVVIPL